MKNITALGLMSGTSMDGIDIALIRSDGQDFIERGPFHFVAYEERFRLQMEQGLEDALHIGERTERPGKLATLEDEITTLHKTAIDQFLDKFDISRSEIDLIGFHGQTVLHRPKKSLTVQLGDGQKLANATAIEVIYDMRANDIANGGQGAPLVPVYHRALSGYLPQNTSNDEATAFFNIGGISNITYVGQDGELIAFDCGPGNMLIDQWVKSRASVDFDKGGAIARSGEIIPSICDDYLAHAYYELPVPKSLDRKDFEALENDKISLADGARTLTYLTTLSIERALRFLPSMPASWVICGGGTLNAVMMEDLGKLAKDKGARLFSANEAGFSSMAVEAEAFAYLAIRSKLGKNLTFPTTTGCNRPVSGGVSAMPKIAI